MMAEIVQRSMCRQKEEWGNGSFDTYTRAGVFVFISNANIQRSIAGRKSINS
jgi:hypothetical protein